MNNHSLPAKKSLGQHFLKDDYIPKKMCEAGNLQAGETVLEIGPGTGVLTEQLLAFGATVHAIETDERSCLILEKRFAPELEEGRLFLHHTDMRDGLPDKILAKLKNYKVIANIPYYITGFLLRTLLEQAEQPEQIVFLVQKEVAERIARDQKSSLLSLSVRVFGTPHYVQTVKRGHFQPPPQVDSAILSITDISHKHISHHESRSFFLLLKAGFAHKRKQILPNLSREWPKETVLLALDQAGIAPQTRAEDITLPEWLKLFRALQ